MSDSGQHKRVFIGGIAGGIGSALAKRLSSANWSVGGYGRPSEKWSEFKESHDQYNLYDADGTDPASLKKAVSGFCESAGGIDAYVHAIGSVFLKPLHLISDEEWQTVLACNLNSAFFAAREVITPMRRQKSGTLIFFSSVAAQAGLSNHEAIAAAKGGIDGLVKSIAATYAANGVRANAIAPGLVRTGATSQLTGNEQALRFSERMHPLGRIGEPDEVASLVAWLVSEEASWMTGQTLSLDGGMGTVLPKPRA
jgi:NAD(P)-dependent dehydrogenase (short-subunit alcohol dehydrogenase family)